MVEMFQPAPQYTAARHEVRDSIHELLPSALRCLALSGDCHV